MDWYWYLTLYTVIAFAVWLANYRYRWYDEDQVLPTGAGVLWPFTLTVIILMAICKILYYAWLRLGLNHIRLTNEQLEERKQFRERRKQILDAKLERELKRIALRRALFEAIHNGIPLDDIQGLLDEYKVREVHVS